MTIIYKFYFLTSDQGTFITFFLFHGGTVYVVILFYQEWTDEKLVWNISLFNGITKIRIPCDFIWLPDIVLYNRFVNMLFTPKYINFS